jgi:hypothetical protein
MSRLGTSFPCYLQQFYDYFATYRCCHATTPCHTDFLASGLQLINDFILSSQAGGPCWHRMDTVTVLGSRLVFQRGTHGESSRKVVGIRRKVVLGGSFSFLFLLVVA